MTSFNLITQHRRQIFHVPKLKSERFKITPLAENPLMVLPRAL